MDTLLRAPAVPEKTDGDEETPGYHQDQTKLGLADVVVLGSQIVVDAFVRETTG